MVSGLAVVGIIYAVGMPVVAVVFTRRHIESPLCGLFGFCVTMWWPFILTGLAIDWAFRTMARIVDKWMMRRLHK